MRFAQASFRGIHNRQMPPMWVVVGPCRGVVGVTFFNIHFPCVFTPDISRDLHPIFRAICARVCRGALPLFRRSALTGRDTF